MKQYTEQEIKSMVTPEIIKKMVEMAEGFEYNERTLRTGTYVLEILFDEYFFYLSGLFEKENKLLFLTLVRRAAEGWNKKCGFNNGIILYPELLEYYIGDNNECFTLHFKNYQPESLTNLELALLHCLIEVLSL